MRYLIHCAALFVSSGLAFADSSDWRQWRGPGDNGSTDHGSYPVNFSANNVLWRTPLPGKGCSTPIVLRQTIYVTAPSQGLDALLAYDWSGKLLWQTTFGPEEEGRHRNGSGANASPVTDGESLFVYFKSGTLAAVNLDGTVRWETNLVDRFGKVNLFWDQGTSPVLTEKHVVMARMHHGDSWLAAFDKTNGRLAWKGGPRLFHAYRGRSRLHDATGDRFCRSGSVARVGGTTRNHPRCGRRKGAMGVRQFQPGFKSYVACDRHACHRRRYGRYRLRP